MISNGFAVFALIPLRLTENLSSESDILELGRPLYELDGCNIVGSDPSLTDLITTYPKQQSETLARRCWIPILFSIR